MLTATLADGVETPRRAKGLTRSQFLFYSFIAFVLLPKIDIISYSVSGVRPEDLLLVVAFPVALAGKNWRTVKVPTAVVLYLVYSSVCLLSGILNSGAMGFTGILFTIRQLQYLVWFIVAAEVAPNLDEGEFRRGMKFIAIVLIIWGLGELSGLIPKIGKFAGSQSRLTLNTSGPYETAVVLAFLAYVCRHFFINTLLYLLLIFTQSRITLAATVFVYVTKNIKRVLIAGAVVGAFLLLQKSGTLALLSGSRLAATSSLSDMVRAMQVTWSVAIPLNSSEEFFNTFYGTGIPIYSTYAYTDLSFFIRAVRWAFIIKSWLRDAFHFFIGWGPGAWFIVDGNYVRILGETGLIGMLSFMAFAWKAITDKSSLLQLRQGIVVILISAVFIDIAVSSKAMTIFWFFYGLSAVGRLHKSYLTAK